MKKLTLLLSAFLLAFAAQAASLPSHKDVENMLNLSATAGPKVELGTLITKKKVQVLKATYSYAVQGGASTASINLLDTDGKAAKLPDNAVVKQVLIDVLTAPTSDGSATIALTAQSAGDLKAATAIASITGLVAGVPVGSAATMIKLTAERTVQMSVAVAPLTAGKFNVFIEYYLSD